MSKGLFFFRKLFPIEACSIEQNQSWFRLVFNLGIEHSLTIKIRNTGWTEALGFFKIFMGKGNSIRPALPGQKNLPVLGGIRGKDL